MDTTPKEHQALLNEWREMVGPVGSKDFISFEDWLHIYKTKGKKVKFDKGRDKKTR